MIVNGPNGDNNFFVMKNVAESMLKNSGIEKPTTAQIVAKMVELAKSVTDNDNLPMGFTLYKTSGADTPPEPPTEPPTMPPSEPPTSAPVYDVPDVPTEVPTEPPTMPPSEPPTSAPVYDVPEPTTVPDPPTENPDYAGTTGMNNVRMENKGRADGKTIARNDQEFYSKFPQNKFEILSKQGNIYFFRKK